jgi:hypothetical protein
MMTIFTTSLFNLLILLFIWVEIFGFLNRGRVYRKFDFQEIENYNPKLYLFFYASKITYLIFILIGFFTNYYIYSIILFSLGFFRYFAIRTKKNILINLYDFLNPFISSIILIIILCQEFFR